MKAASQELRNASTIFGYATIHPEAGLVAEKYSTNPQSAGPTGEFHFVEKAEIVDYGGNVYGVATTATGAARIQRKLRIPTRIVAVEVSATPAF